MMASGVHINFVVIAHQGKNTVRRRTLHFGLSAQGPWAEAGRLIQLSAMQTFKLATSVAGFLLLGGLSLAYLFVRLGEAEVRQNWGYTVYADFANAGGLDPGSSVEIAGVPVGQISAINLIEDRARVTLTLQKEIVLQEDAIASIQTKGLLGERYMLITPGGSEETIAAGGKIRETESPLDLPSLLAAYVGLRDRAAKTPKETSAPKSSATETPE